MAVPGTMSEVSEHEQHQQTVVQNALLKTRILPTDASKIGRLNIKSKGESALEDWNIDWESGPDYVNLQHAADQLRTSDIPVAFPTETVYGLGADATRSNAVGGIFKAKKRPADNPLIVHFASLSQLRNVLRPHTEPFAVPDTASPSNDDDAIPSIYKPLIQRFWPGPLTIILPNPSHSPLASEVTAGLSTFGARMPRNLLALGLIKLSRVPIAAPSANASTKPSPTTAEHVYEDMNGRIETIIDGGPCDVGVESTVVDGLGEGPPTILRPGGITIEMLRQCEGWENVQAGYKNKAEQDSKPRAPGMKYRHYSPKAPVMLFEPGSKQPGLDEVAATVKESGKVGVIRTKTWQPSLEEEAQEVKQVNANGTTVQNVASQPQLSNDTSLLNPLSNLLSSHPPTFTVATGAHGGVTIHEIDIGQTPSSIARGLFSALRLLDGYGVDKILVEGIADEGEGAELAAAVMNRIRKAADVKIEGQ